MERERKAKEFFMVLCCLPSWQGKTLWWKESPLNKFDQLIILMRTKISIESNLHESWIPSSTLMLMMPQLTMCSSSWSPSSYNRPFVTSTSWIPASPGSLHHEKPFGTLSGEHCISTTFNWTLWLWGGRVIMTIVNHRSWSLLYSITMFLGVVQV